MIPLRDKPHTVYRMYDASGTVLYVGCTSDIGRRTTQHSTKRPWFGDVVRIDVEHCASQQEALARETELIKQLNPKHQITFRQRSLNGWDRRRRNRDEAHRQDKPCNEWNCKACIAQFGPKQQRIRAAS